MTGAPRQPWAGRLLHAVYRLLWGAVLPAALGYFLLRSRRDPAYRRHLGERLGAVPAGTPRGAVWVHAVSLGEMRSAVPLVRALLDRGERVITSHLTPAGRRAAETAFGPEIAAGQMAVRYLPLDVGWIWRRALRAVRPRLILSLEIEVWPVMIAEAARAGIPLWLVNSQYPERSLARDLPLARRGAHPVAQVTGVLAKSDGQAERFRALGAPRVVVCGELRFDQPVPPRLLQAAAALRPTLGGRPVVTLASVVAGEDAVYLQAIRAARAALVPPPLFVHVPRAPERFGPTADLLRGAGLRVLRRSKVLDADLHCAAPEALAQADILLGDSMGEMYFYLALGDLAIVGGGFVAKGAHNVIEPLALRRPVLVGPQVWTIEYPGREAVAAGVVQICPDSEALAGALIAALSGPEAAEAGARAEAFLARHSGATARVLAALDAASPQSRA